MEHPVSHIEYNLALMQELLSCGTNINLWRYDHDGHLVSTTSQHLVLDRIFEESGCKKYMMEYGQTQRLPLILGGSLGLTWCAIFSDPATGQRSTFVMGPIFNTEISTKTIEQSVRDYNIDLAWRREYIRLLGSLPVVSSILFFQYALMLHYCVNGEKLTRSDIQHSNFSTAKDNPSRILLQEDEKGDRMQTWLAERALLSMVREGDLNYQKAMDNAAYLSGGVRSGGDNPVLHAIVSCTTFTSLCVREAIQAGISPDTAYSVGDGYIQSMVSAKDMSELISINHDMYVDFISRVHKHRTNPKVSGYIQLCRDYIETHTGDDLSLPVLAKYVGYSEYHLSRKFKQEMGISISAYIRYARVERAKFLLANTKYSISQIATDLHFCSSSHFSNVFLEVTGKKPQEYRREQPGG